MNDLAAKIDWWPRNWGQPVVYQRVLLVIKNNQRERKLFSNRENLMTLRVPKIAQKKSVSTPRKTFGPDESPEEFAASQEKLTVISNMICNALVPVQEISDYIKKTKESQRLNLDILVRTEQKMLVHVAANRSLEHLQMLQSLGANVRIQTDNGISAMHMARSSEVFRWLKIQGIPVDVKTSDGDTPLHMNTMHSFISSFDLAKTLIDLGADVNAKNKKGMRPLHVLTLGAGLAEDKNKKVHLLVSSGAKINLGDEKGWTPMHWVANHQAMSSTISSTILKMVQLGADFEVCDKWKLRPIHIAANNDNKINIWTLNALGASMLGVISNNTTTDECLHESRFISAIKTNDPEILMTHLKIFPDPSPEDIKKSKSIMSKKGLAGDSQNLGAVLNSHLAAKAIDDMLNTVSHPSPPTGKLSDR